MPPDNNQNLSSTIPTPETPPSTPSVDMTPPPEQPESPRARWLLIALLLVLALGLGGWLAWRWWPAFNNSTWPQADSIDSEVPPATTIHDSEVSEVTDMSNWQTYRNEKYGFSINIPPNFDLYITKGKPERMVKIDLRTDESETDNGIFHVVPSRIDVKNPYVELGDIVTSVGISITPISLLGVNNLDEFQKKFLEKQDYNNLELGRGNVNFSNSRLNGQEIIMVMLDEELLDINTIHNGYLYGISLVRGTNKTATPQEYELMARILQAIKFI
ncbi:MAG: hypothetical protein HYT47_02205 [Candidatus Vogelbacteria bacterium]|nr:hypothetical protein [Candidatus Vogelbacteria bacterium]